MQINQGVVDEQAASLGNTGWPFTPRQLYYAACAAVEAPEVTMSTSQIGCGVVTFLLGVVLSALASFYFIPAVLVGMVVIGLGLQRRRFERNRPTTRALAVSWADFERDFVRPLRGHGAKVPKGLLLHADVPEASTGELLPVAADAPAVLVCDRRETAVLLRAALEQSEQEVAVCDEPGLPDGFAGTVFTLHDCSKNGCQLPLRVAARVSGEVVDIGLRPAQVRGRLQVIESAPELIPPELGRLLSVDEVAFLANGTRVELAVARTEQLVMAVQAATGGEIAAVPAAAVDGRVRLSDVQFFEQLPESGAAALGGEPATA